jgi:hypothetical protein
MWITISAGRSFALGVEGDMDGISACAVVLALRGVGREVNGDGMLMFCSNEKERERVVEDNVSRDGVGDGDGAGDWEGTGVDGDDAGEEVMLREGRVLWEELRSGGSADVKHVSTGKAFYRRN